MSQAESALRINIEDIVRGSLELLGNWLTCRNMAVCKMRTFGSIEPFLVGCAISNIRAIIIIYNPFHIKRRQECDIRKRVTGKILFKNQGAQSAEPHPPI
jgi:hypothetical protein